jgi:hypothetical protein
MVEKVEIPFQYDSRKMCQELIDSAIIDREYPRGVRRLIDEKL